jgi:transcriptional regulator
MYVPDHFAEPGTDACHALMRDYPFGLLVTAIDGAPFASHLPFMLDPARGAHGALIAHMARGNPHWRAFAMGGESLVVFQGPHAYVSPSWYETREKVVPTWNYAAVHAYGAPRIVEDESATRAILMRLIDVSEAGFEARWRTDGQPEDFLAAMVKGVVAFEMPIARLEGKWKMSQNRLAEDRAGAARGLAASDDPMARAVAAVMRARQTSGSDV